MTTKDEALKLALEAAYLAGFNDSAEGYNGEYPFRDHGATPTKDRHWIDRRDEYIRKALAEQPAQQPVFSFKMQLKPGWGSQYPYPAVIGEPDWQSIFGNIGDVVTFYTSPQPSKPWVGLTDEEQSQVAWSCGAMSADWLEFARAIETKLKEKNNG